MNVPRWIKVACGALMAIMASLLLIFGQADDAFGTGWYLFNLVIGLGLVATGLHQRSP